MSQLILQLNNSANWIEVHNTVHTSDGFINQRPIPIAPVYVAISFENFIGAVWCRSNEIRERKWQRGCRITQVVPSGFPTFGQPGAALETKIISQNLPTLLTFTRFSGEYFLRIDFYTWFTNLQVVVWQYNGIVSDTTTESLADIQQQLTALEQQP